MEKHYSNEIPEKIENLGAKRRLNYDIHELSEDEIKKLWERENYEEDYYEWFADLHRYSYNSIEIGVAQWTRDGIINAIIRDKYRQDEMEAITNNMAAVTGVFFETLVSEGIVAATKYLLSSINDENSERFKEMQEWRAMAKKIASEIIKQ